MHSRLVYLYGQNVDVVGGQKAPEAAVLQLKIANRPGLHN